MPVLKVDPANEPYDFILKTPTAASIVLSYEYHLGGYANTPRFLTEFMNRIYQDFGLPTDQVYTAKLLFGVLDLIGKEHFPENSRILIVHSGGLQGNRSLPDKTLVFQ